MRQAPVELLVLLLAPLVCAAADPIADKYRQLYGHDLPQGRGGFFDDADAFQDAFDRAFPAKNPFIAPGPGWALDPSLEPGVSARLIDESARVALEVRIPGLGPRPVDISVAGETVRLSYRKAASGAARVLSVDASERVEHLFPVPVGADPQTLRVEREDDRVRFVFSRLAPSDAEYK